MCAVHCTLLLAVIYRPLCIITTLVETHTSSIFERDEKKVVESEGRRRKPNEMKLNEMHINTMSFNLIQRNYNNFLQIMS